MSIRELRASLAALEEVVSREQEIVITRHGRPLARVTPIAPCHAAPSHADLRTSIPAQTVPSELLVREDRDRG